MAPPCLDPSYANVWYRGAFRYDTLRRIKIVFVQKQRTSVNMRRIKPTQDCTRNLKNFTKFETATLNTVNICFLLWGAAILTTLTLLIFNPIQLVFVVSRCAAYSWAYLLAFTFAQRIYLPSFFLIVLLGVLYNLNLAQRGADKSTVSAATIIRARTQT